MRLMENPIAVEFRRDPTSSAQLQRSQSRHQATGLPVCICIRCRRAQQLVQIPACTAGDVHKRARNSLGASCATRTDRMPASSIAMTRLSSTEGSSVLMNARKLQFCVATVCSVQHGRRFRNPIPIESASLASAVLVQGTVLIRVLHIDRSNSDCLFMISMHYVLILVPKDS